MELKATLIYSDEKMERLYRGALRVLRETGFALDHDHFLNQFERRKMKVDRTARRVFVTEDLVRDLLAPDPDRYRDFHLKPNLPAGFGLGGSYPKYYDWPTRSSRRAESKTLIELVRAFGSIPEFGSAGRILTLNDVPQAIEPIIATALVIKHSPKPGRGEVYRADNIPYLVELGEIVTGKPRCADYVPSCTFLVPPLKMTRDEGDMILEKAKYDLPAVAGTMPSSGATSPVTREGTVVIELAELMAVWLCYRLVNPAIELGTISASSIFDMREGTCSFSAPEAIIQDCATSQICWRYFGASARMSSAYVDAKTPGLQATYEKLFKAWWSFRFIGFAPYPGGLLEAGMAFSPAQAILDWELWKTHNAIFTPAPAVEDEVPFQDIQAICETGGTFLETDHTAEHFKKVLLHSDILDRSPRRSDVEEASKADGILDRCQAKYEAIRARAPEYIAPDQICKAVDRVVERARKQLVK